ncbi:MAG: YjjG family noncanonical pyrimidine nucleotidase [Flavobacterium sp.]|nr:YjjG family noncanonical pyrimidine nucleotidase [Flavobacterium sp.]
MNAKISDVFFDLDHTLWDFEKNSALAFETIFKKHNIDLDLHAFLNHYNPINFQYWQLYQHDKITTAELRYGRLKDVFDLMDLEVTDALIDLLSDEYIHYLPQHNHLFEGTIEILDYLKDKYNLHIITNGFHEVQGNKIKNSKIGHYFSTITNSEMAGVKKPNPQIFEYALQLAKTKKETSIMIGDSFEADVEGAMNSGIDAIFFNTNNVQVDQKIKQISHLKALKNYL